MDVETREPRARAIQVVASQAGVDPDRVRVVVSPYRVCPIGAHVDHQGGPMLGMAIGAHTSLAYAPTDDGRLRLTSGSFEGEVDLALRGDSSDEAAGPQWGVYARGAARLFAEAAPAAHRGLVGRVTGALPGSGLGSSASVLLAYLTALADVNRVTLSPHDRVSLSRRVENEVVGVASGILDPASIEGARRGELLFIDSGDETWASHGLGAGAAPPRILIAFTGIERRLASSGFNDRVEECHRAAEILGDAAGLERPAGRRARLGDLDDGVFEAHVAALPDALARRARHFFGERARVLAGLADWLRGDLERFGERMNASCESSLHQYETGSEELASLQEILVATPGVFGARFSGAGFGGCSVALIDAEHADEAAESVASAFARAHPGLATRMQVAVVDADDGVRIETSSPETDRPEPVSSSSGPGPRAS
jgi:galacturonokinase